MEPTTDRPRRSGSPMRRYLPIIAILVVIALGIGAFAIFSGGDDDDDGTVETDSAASGAPVRLFEEGDDPDDFFNCDGDTGRVRIPTIFAPPCVETFDGDNGGATYQGVTGDTIKIVVYVADPALDPLAAAQIRAAGADVNPAAARQVFEGFVELFNQQVELYGRQVDVEFYTGTGAGDDVEKARADAIAIADMEPFAVLDGPTQASVFGDEITSREILCVGGCTLAAPAEFVEERAPFIWPIGPNPEQTATLTANMIGTQFAGRPAEYAGDEAFHDEERVFGFLHYDTVDGRYTPGAEQFIAQLEDEWDVELAIELPYLLDLERAPESARTLVAQLKDAGVTTIVFQGDPLMPKYFTEEATRQGYFPEWVIGPSVLVDSNTFARTFDQQQWAHAFGISLPPVAGNRDIQESYILYQWQFCRDPENNTDAVLLPPVQALFIGLTLAGPDLTPGNFERGWFAYPVTGGTPVDATVSRGNHDIWPETEWNGTDDTGVIWWDPDAVGETGTGLVGEGLYQFAEMGERFRPEDWPEEPIPLFDPETSVSKFETFPPGSEPPDYPSPCAG